ncbi:synembryn [Nasonia vitripennis]|uniref:Synembryn n=1 Tax=Nasonia vitripennis TaxID=7425 RepID=A0A7M7G9Q7_NASVI|nr:synembryn [Nasonia vitripennis]XP_008215959.1 synembryn [Nasonia vitripennis]XP_008215960.1 synembryn [Nasonia vitripennis]XP_032456975.1 synembryn [Nasonia vitripennis]
MEDLFLKLKSENDQDFSQALTTFVNNYASVTKFEFLDKENFRSQIWEAIFLHLNSKEQYYIHEQCLATLRILSRDKTNLDSILTKEKLNVILEYAGLNIKQEKYTISSVANEAQKLLCNLLFNSPKIQTTLIETSCLECVIDRISKYNENNCHDTKLFDVRIIFLVTALNISTRNFVCTELHGDIQLIKMLENVLQYYSMDNREIKDNDATLTCEILKALFNLFYQPKDLTTEEMEIYEKLVFILRNLCFNNSKQHKENLISNTVNLLTVIPKNCYSNLIVQLPNNQQDIILYEDVDMSTINILIIFLNNKLECKTNLIENLSPILSCFIRMCKTERLIRKYTRMQVLPPLKDVLQRPEEGTTLRNKLCKLLTTPITEIRDLVAEFLFVLCKEKVGRMIKYTGYGNAAGMFANKGLLGPDHAKVDYSSESEDSETEEYEKYKEKINPVVGCYESPKPNPLEGMTEEQKEYEAMKLVSLVDQLQRKGLIQPCRVGEDGKPKAIEHVLELKEQLPKQQIHRQESDSD